MLDERKKELLAQQKFSENEHLQILDTMTRHERVEFQQNLVQERQAFQKALLQEVHSMFFVQPLVIPLPSSLLPILISSHLPPPPSLPPSLLPFPLTCVRS